MQEAKGLDVTKRKSINRKSNHMLCFMTLHTFLKRPNGL